MRLIKAMLLLLGMLLQPDPAAMRTATYSDFVLSNLWSNCYMRQLGTLVSVPLHSGTVIKIPRWRAPYYITSLANLSASKVSAISSGVGEQVAAITNVSLMSAMAAVSGTLKQFAGAYGYNDLLVIANRTDFFEGAYENLARDLAYRTDTYTYNNISANANLYAWAAAAGSKSTDVLRGKIVSQMAPYMDAYGVPRWDDDCFIAVTHPLAQADIFNDISATGFVAVTQYGDPNRIYKGEIGQMFGIRFLLSNIISRAVGAAGTTGTVGLSVKATGTTVLVLAPDSFYSMQFEGGGVEVIHHELGSAGAADAVNSIGTVGVKLWYGVAPTLAADHRMTRWPIGLGINL